MGRDPILISMEAVAATRIQFVRAEDCGWKACLHARYPRWRHFRNALAVLMCGWCLMSALGAEYPTLIVGTQGVAQGRTNLLSIWFSNPTEVGGLQLDLLFNPSYVDTERLHMTNELSGVLADAALIESNRFRMLFLSTNNLPLSNGLLVELTIVARTNAPNGLLRVPILSVTNGQTYATTMQGDCQ